MMRVAAGLSGVGVIASLALFFSGGVAKAGEDAAPKRIVSAGASVTEILYALGMGNAVVATDVSSQFPPEAKKTVKIGYHRNLTAEGVLAQRPDLVLATEEAGPPPTIAQLRAAALNVVIVPSTPTPAGAYEKIRRVGEHVGKKALAEKTIATMKNDLAALDQSLRTKKRKPRVLFIYARGSGALLVSGTETAAAGIISLAHGENAVDGFSNYKPLTAEAVIAAAPDVILIPERALSVVGGINGVLEAPGVKLTPAGKNNRIVAIDDVLLLGFGPRLPKAAQWLATVLHPPAPSP